MAKSIYTEGYTQNRELSWMRFNNRVLDEAKDKDVPLLERLKFAAIHASNLDEFFTVRVGSLYEMKRAEPDGIDKLSGMSVKQQLDAIYFRAKKDIAKREKIMSELKAELNAANIFQVMPADCSKSEQKYLRRYFHDKVLPVVSPQVVDTVHPLPRLQSGVIYCAGILRYKNRDSFAFAAVPDVLPKMIKLPDETSCRYVLMEDLIHSELGSLIKGSTVLETLKFRILRSADVDPEDEMFEDIEDYREKMEKVLKQRRRMRVVRLDLSRKPSTQLKKYLMEHLKAEPSCLFEFHQSLDMKYAFSLGSLLKAEDAQALQYEKYEPKLSAAFDYEKPIFDQVKKKDVLLSYPYESMDPFLLLVRQAAGDPDVTSIRITIYRLARQARLVDYLCQAAENGKEVDVLIELKARFDEQNNIDYSERLEDSGVTVMYGYTNYKVHSKICLITRMKNSRPEHVVLIATGNFNENTAKQYTDLAYLTGRAGIARDAAAFFRNMMIGKLDGSYRNLLVAPVSLKSGLIEMIRAEAEKGENGRIIAKVNAITDEELIRELQKASAAGVQIDLIVRGISCILPEVKGRTDTIHIRSIVGRYLEHSRIYVFGEGKEEKMYISSADFMTRNTDKRVEIAVPIMSPQCRQQIHQYLDICFRDNVKARKMKPDGKYAKFKSGEEKLSSQDELMRITKGSDQTIPVPQRRQSIAVFRTVYQKKNSK
ncbi:MAG: polyphosphate kinase 1 [Solobacterium sp.]|nr:polyphosphate kinase 1 [Solobacterium sp.]